MNVSAAMVSVARERLVKASLTPRRATVGRCSAAASRAAREAWPAPPARPSASASTVFTRPARRAGTAVKSATAARMSPSAASSGSGASALGVGVASTFDIGFEQQRRDRRAGDQPEQRGDEADRQVFADEQRDDPARREADRLQQADLAPLREHAPADHGRDGEPDREQREQRVDPDHERVRARLVGDRVAHLVPVGERAAACRAARAGGGGERVGGLGVAQPDADARAPAPRRPAPTRCPGPSAGTSPARS